VNDIQVPARAVPLFILEEKRQDALAHGSLAAVVAQASAIPSGAQRAEQAAGRNRGGQAQHPARQLCMRGSAAGRRLGKRSMAVEARVISREPMSLLFRSARLRQQCAHGLAAEGPSAVRAELSRNVIQVRNYPLTRIKRG
jgi:hypothetical protein